jgi:hypothetical protein
MTYMTGLIKKKKKEEDKAQVPTPSQFENITYTRGGVPITQEDFEKERTITQNMPEHQEEENKTGGVIGRDYISPGKYKYTIGGQEVSESEYNIAMMATTEKASLSPEAEKQMALLGLNPFEAQMLEQQRQQEIAEMIGQAGMIEGAQGGMEGQIEGQMSPIDWEQALAQVKDPQNIMSMVQSGVVGGFVGFKSGAVIGAKIGMVGGPKGAIAGAVVMGAIGFGLATWRAIDNNIKAERSAEISATTTVLRDDKQAQIQLIALTRMFPERAHEFVEAYNIIDTRIEQAYADLVVNARSDLNLRLGQTGTVQMQRFENYLQPGGMRDINNLKMRYAIANPDFEAGFNELMMSQMSIGEE